MRRAFILVLLGLLLAAALVALVETSPGYVLVSWGLTTVESSLWVALFFLLLFNLAFYALLRLLRRLAAGGGALSSWLTGRREQRSRRLAEAGMLAFAAGNWQKARRLLLRAANGASDPALSYLAAARASHKLGEIDRARELLDQASLSAGATDAVRLTRAELLLDNGDAAGALVDLEDMRERSNRYPHVLSLLQRAYEATGNWEGLAALLPQLRKRKLADAQALDALERHACLQRLRTATGRRELELAWAACPDRLRRDVAVVEIYAPLLAASGAVDETVALLVASLRKNWSSSLADLYGRLPGGDPNKRLKLGEQWLRSREDDPQLLRCLGRLSLRCELWGQARDYFEASNARRPSTETSAELARLLFHLGEREKAAQAYRQGVLLAHPELPELPQPGKGGSLRAAR